MPISFLSVRMGASIRLLYLAIDAAYMAALALSANAAHFVALAALIEGASGSILLSTIAVHSLMT